MTGTTEALGKDKLLALKILNLKNSLIQEEISVF